MAVAAGLLALLAYYRGGTELVMEGLRGIIIGTIAGTSIPGGPYISFPIISAVHEAGAGIGTVVAFVTGWAMRGLGKLPFELAIMGTRFTLVRMLLFAVFPVIAGWIAYVVL